MRTSVAKSTEDAKLTQKNVAKEDLRVRRTRKALQEALISLTAEKGFANVTIRDISERAMVNRATFYRYYRDKYDLLDRYMDEQYELLETLNTTVTGNPPSGLVRLLEHIHAHADFFRVMLGEKGDPAFNRKIRLYIEGHFRQMLPARDQKWAKANANQVPLDLGLAYISHASVGAIIWWLEKEMPYSAEQLAAWSVQLSTADWRACLGA